MMLGDLMKNKKQKVKDMRKKARRKKIKRSSKIYHKKINKRKYYGTQKHINKYEELINQAIDIDKVEEFLNKVTGKESIIDNIANQLDADSLLQTKIITQVGDTFEEVYTKGSRRVFDTKGDKVEVGEIKNMNPVREMMSDQKKHFKNMADDARDKIRDNLREGVKKGKGIDEMSDEIVDDLDNMTSNRAKTIARSEVTKASARGTQQAMEEAGIDEIIWLATMDNRTCETCEDLHETHWKREEAPMPVKDTHPNCRCTVVADVD